MTNGVHHMKTTLLSAPSVLTALAVLALASCSSDNSNTAALIDGSDGLSNFDIVGDANWAAGDGAIEATMGSGASFLVTKESYDNFRLRAEFWVSEDANSGIYMRCQDVAGITDRNCYEANIYDQRPDPSFGTGGIVHIAPVAEPYPKAGGQWNTYEITVDGPRMVVTLNGQQTVDASDQQFSAGPVALQWAAGTVRFRSLEIEPL